MLTINPNHLTRVFYFGVGSAAAVYAYNELRKSTWGGAREVAEAWGTLPPPTPKQQQEQLLGAKARATLAQQWNTFIDSTLGRLATELGKRGI